MDPTAAAAACIVFGFLLVLVEIFLIPGIGFAGVLGATLICVGGGLVWVEHGMAAGLATLVGSGLLSLLLVWAFWRSGAAKRFVLHSKLDRESREKDQHASLVGKTGRAVTSLRPAGQAEIDGERYDVVTDGAFVEVGVAIRVDEVEGFRVVVEPIPEAGPAGPTEDSQENS